MYLFNAHKKGVLPHIFLLIIGFLIFSADPAFALIRKKSPSKILKVTKATLVKAKKPLKKKPQVRKKVYFLRNERFHNSGKLAGSGNSRNTPSIRVPDSDPDEGSDPSPHIFTTADIIEIPSGFGNYLLTYYEPTVKYLANSSVAVQLLGFAQQGIEEKVGSLIRSVGGGTSGLPSGEEVPSVILSHAHDHLYQGLLNLVYDSCRANQSYQIPPFSLPESGYFSYWVSQIAMAGNYNEADPEVVEKIEQALNDLIASLQGGLRDYHNQYVSSPSLLESAVVSCAQTLWINQNPEWRIFDSTSVCEAVGGEYRWADDFSHLGCFAP